MEMAKQWRDGVNRLGGDITLVGAQIGIRYHRHFIMSELWSDRGRVSGESEESTSIIT